MTTGCSAKIKQFDFDFASIEIKGRSSLGNIITKYPVRKITLKEKGLSTLGSQSIWYDENTGRLNTEERGKLIGGLNKGDQILSCYKNGTYEITEYDLNNRYAYEDLILIEKFNPNTILSVIYFEGDKNGLWLNVSRSKRLPSEPNSILYLNIRTPNYILFPLMPIQKCYSHTNVKMNALMKY